MRSDPSPGSGSPRSESRGEQWARVKDLFQQALDQPADLREAWLDRATGADPDVRREVQALLASHDSAGDFLEQPPGPGPDVRIFPPGSQLGRFEIVAELGRGGGGIVYLARDQELHRQVALKFLPAGDDPELRDRLRREARAASTIEHESIARIYDLKEVEDQLFIVSEYVRGRTLRAALVEGALPRDRVLAIARGIAHALQAAHDARVIHRDLKPENILLPDAGGVKVVDFGIARVLGGGMAVTRHGTLLGTPGYMAPEQLLGTAADARADIYAFGIVLSEMISGRHPGLPAPPTAPPPKEGDLIQLARQCTQVDPSARIQTAALLVAALDGISAGAHSSRSAARWWWEFHQAAAATTYLLTLWPAWWAREAIGGLLGRAFFVLILGAVVVSAFLRLHLWFTARFYPVELDWVRRRSTRLIAVSDGVFAVGLVSGALLIRAGHSSLDFLLLSIGLGAAVAALVIEVATTRAAFKVTN